MKSEKILRKIKIDSLLGKIREKSEDYQTQGIIDRAIDKSIYLTSGAPTSDERPLFNRGDFYLLMRAVIPKSCFGWASEKK